MATVVITGGAGFVGSHLCAALLGRGDRVVAVDNLSTGNEANVAHLRALAAFTLHVHDLTTGLDGLTLPSAIDAVVNLASPASPPRYLGLPIETLQVGSAGTEACLRLATRHGARVVHASTSEVYGDPQEHPQTEAYWGHVNPVGPRSVYDEAKRYAEALAMAYHRAHGVSVGLARIFNTYGPHLDPTDGRVVSNFLSQALTGQPLTVYGDGAQTRSFCYVDDLVAGLVALLDSDLVGPVNLGNPDELTMLELVEVVLEVTGAASALVHEDLPVDDPIRRCPDITLARTRLGWAPKVPLREGLARTAAWYRAALGLVPER